MIMQKPSYPKEKRILWYQSVDRDKRSVTETCDIFHISRKTYYKWRKRDFGMSGNSVNSKLQKNTKLTYEVCEFIAKQKIKTNYGPLKMKLLVKKKLGIDLSTTIIYRFYLRRNLIRKPQKKNPWFAPMKQALIIDKPGVGVQMDIKYVYEKGIRKYQFSVFDPYTEMYYFKVFNTKKSKNAIDTFKKAQKYFKFKILSIQTDNGSEFRGYFHGWLDRQNIPHYFIPKKSPWWNGKVERVHRTMDEEYYQNVHRVWKTPLQWLEYYNNERLHLSLDGMTPVEKRESVTLDC